MRFLKFKWWKDENNRGAVTAILGVASAICVAGVYVFLNDDTAPPVPTVECNSTFTQSGDGNLIQNCGSGDVVIGLTQEKFFEELTRRETQVRADLERAHGAEQTVLLNQLAEVEQQKADIETAYQDNIEELRQLRVRLQKYEDTVSKDTMQKAQQALYEGDRKLADQLLAEVEQDQKEAVELAAQAAYDRGEIAEAEIRWQDAAQHYARAAGLNPSMANLDKAREFAWRAGDYDAALRFGQMVLDHATIHGTLESRATALDNLALMLNMRGRFAEAEKLYREALEIDRATIGAGNPGYAKHLSDLADMVEAQGRYEEAEELYRESLKILQASLPADHLDVVVAQSMLDIFLDEIKPRE